MTASFRAPTDPMDWRPRPARVDDVPALEALIPASVLTFQSAYQIAISDGLSLPVLRMTKRFPIRGASGTCT